MSLCYRKNRYTFPAKSLPRHFCQQKKKDICNETPLCACRGSYTVEAAVVFPLITAFLVVILFFFRVLQVQTEVQEALIYAGRKSAVDSSCVSSDIASLGLATGYFREEIKNSDAVKKYVKNGVNGISFVNSSAEGDYIHLQASCKIIVPIGFFKLDSICLIMGSTNRKWTGRTEGGEEESDPIVYYTETGSVYHLTKNCKYLDLSIHSVKYTSVADLRNKNGHKYYECDRCAAKNIKEGIVFITDYGTVYHTELGCSGLKRTIYEVRLSAVGKKKPCTKCSK